VAACALRLTAAEFPNPLQPEESVTPSVEESSNVPTHADLEAEGLRIRRVYVSPNNIFDVSNPEEARKLFFLVNRLHRRTREDVIRRQLLFEPGDIYSSRLLEESERLLRKRKYLFDAEIDAVEFGDDFVDLEVRTRDTWTLNGGASLHRGGGKNKVRFEIEDSNFLGTGKDLTVNRISTVDRTTSLVGYRDPNLLGSRSRLGVWWGENSDGDLRQIEIERPFYALDTRRAAGFRSIVEERVDPLYNLGLVFNKFRHREELFEGYWGMSSGLNDGTAWRWRFGYTFHRDRFDSAPNRRETIFLPEQQTLSYPWIGVEMVEDGFVEATDLDKIGRTEDLNLGSRLRARLGFSSESWGGDRDEAIFNVVAERGIRQKPGRLFLTSAYASGRWGNQGTEDLTIGATARFYQRNLNTHHFYVRVQADIAHDLDRDRQLLLGGDSGLRGYPLRFQDGDRRYLLTLEQRFYSQRDMFRLVNVGAAVFFDMGKAWFSGQEDTDDLGVLKDIGFGLRLSSSRSSRGTMIHFDVAFPLDGRDSISDVQWLVSTKETF
jgi:outer membrane protein assembly factor BamA